MRPLGALRYLRDSFSLFSVILVYHRTPSTRQFQDVGLTILACRVAEPAWALWQPAYRFYSRLDVVSYVIVIARSRRCASEVSVCC